jgi:hypothetical protein
MGEYFHKIAVKIKCREHKNKIERLNKHVHLYTTKNAVALVTTWNTLQRK